jgi:hypothetical protein
MDFLGRCEARANVDLSLDDGKKDIYPNWPGEVG